MDDIQQVDPFGLTPSTQRYNASRNSTGAPSMSSSSYSREDMSTSSSASEDIWSITMPDGAVLENPYSLTSSEWQLYQDYISGKFFWNPANKRAAEAAYNKYQQALQWYNDNSQNAWSTEYNSESATAERMSEAGLDARFIGTDAGSQASAGTSNTPTQVTPSGTSDALQVFGTVQELLSGVAGIASTVFGGMSAVGSIENLRSSTALNRMNLLGGIINLLPDQAFSSDESFSSYFNEDLFKGLGFSSRDFKKSQSMLSRMKIPVSSMRDYWSSSAEAQQERSKWLEVFSNPLYDGSSDGTDLLKSIINAENQSRLLKAMYQSTVDSYNAQIYSSASPELASQALDSSQRQILTQEQLQEMDLQQLSYKLSFMFPLWQRATSLIESENAYDRFVGLSLYSSFTNPQSTLYGIANQAIGTGLDPSNSAGRVLSDVSSAVDNITSGLWHFLSMKPGEFFGVASETFSKFVSELSSGVKAEATSVWSSVKSGLSRFMQNVGKSGASIGGFQTY